MLAYRHAFHAGNHADVLKHLVLTRLLRHMNLKDKGYRLIDSHAGAGRYALHAEAALKTGEYRDGIGGLWGRDDLPAALADYVRQVQLLNPDGTLASYPGSPLLAHGLLRAQDQLRLFELHPADHRLLHDLLGTKRGVEVHHADGFAALKSQLPPPTRRALVLVDPSYEGLGDYRRVLEALTDALRRFAVGTYVVWYPRVQKPGAAQLLHGLKALAPKSWVHARLDVGQSDALGFGLTGSGVFVLNPPYTLHDELRELLPWLCAALGQYAGATHALEQRQV
jgi:23S rRNA (adenine2030-N6)-methyltransferase